MFILLRISVYWCLLVLGADPKQIKTDTTLLANAVSLETKQKLSQRKTKGSHVVSLSKANRAAALIPRPCLPSGERRAGSGGPMHPVLRTRRPR